MKLHDLVLLQGLVGASGVFVVLSGERSGALHFFEGRLYHAETTDLSGDAAALEILSWRDGEFISSDQGAAENTTVSAPLAALLRSVLEPNVSEPGASEEDASGSSEAEESRGGEPAGAERDGFKDAAGGVAVGGKRPSEPPSNRTTGVRRMERPGLAGAPSGSSRGAPHAPASPRRIAAAATPGTAAQTPRAALRAAESHGVTHVLVSPQGELIDGHGADANNLASRITYVARLAELIGQAMGSGTTRCLKVRAAGSEMSIHRHADGHVSGSLGPVDN